MSEAFVVVVTIFWIVVGWRIMRALERMADTADRGVRGSVQLFPTHRDDDRSTP